MIVINLHDFYDEDIEKVIFDGRDGEDIISALNISDLLCK